MELAAEWIKIPDGNGGLQKVWLRDSKARSDLAQLESDAFKYLGRFTGNIDSASIDPGIYYLSGLSIALSGGTQTVYGTFIQFPGTFKVQLVIGGPNGAGGIMESRRYLTGSSSWTAWS